MRKILIFIGLILLIGCKGKQEGAISIYTLSYMQGQVDYVNRETSEYFFDEAKEMLLEKRKYELYPSCSNIAYMFLKIHDREIVAYTNYFVDYKIRRKK